MNLDPDPVSLVVLTALSTVPEMNLWPLGHSYSIPMKILAVTPISTPFLEGWKLARFIAFSAKLGNLACKALKVIFLRGTSHECRFRHPDKNPAWLTPDEWE